MKKEHPSPAEELQAQDDPITHREEIETTRMEERTKDGDDAMDEDDDLAEDADAPAEGRTTGSGPR